MQIFVEYNGKNYLFVPEETTMISELRELVSKKTDIPSGMINLRFHSQYLQDEYNLASYKINESDTIHLSIRQSNKCPETNIIPVLQKSKTM